MAAPKMAPAPFSFPSNPNPGDTFTSPDGRTWEWNGSQWVLVSATPGQLWLQGTGTAIYYNAGDVGVGTGASPAFKLDVNGNSNATSLYCNGVPFAVFT